MRPSAMTIPQAFTPVIAAASFGSMNRRTKWRVPHRSARCPTLRPHFSKSPIGASTARGFYRLPGSNAGGPECRTEHPQPMRSRPLQGTRRSTGSVASMRRFSSRLAIDEDFVTRLLECEGIAVVQASPSASGLRSAIPAPQRKTRRLPAHPDVLRKSDVSRFSSFDRARPRRLCFS